MCSKNMLKDQELVNISDGVIIEGFKPMSPDQYVNKITNLTSIKLKEFSYWWKTFPTYSSELFMAKWKSSEPRKEIFAFFSEFREITNITNKWTTSYLPKLSKLCDLEVNLSKQFPRRLYRSTLFKISLLIHQQLQVNNNISEDKRKIYSQESRKLLIDYANRMETQAYALCDYLEQQFNSISTINL